MYRYFHSPSSGFNSTLNVLLHFLLQSLSCPVGFTKIQSSRDRPFSQWRGRNSWSSVSLGIYLCWMPINYPCSDFTESALSLYCWNRTWIAHEWKMLFNVWHPTPISSEVESQWDRFETRCYYNARLNLLKKWSKLICFFPPFLCFIIQLLFSFKLIWGSVTSGTSNILSKISSIFFFPFQLKFGVTDSPNFTNLTATPLLFCFLFHFHLWHISDVCTCNAHLRGLVLHQRWGKQV